MHQVLTRLLKVFAALFVVLLLEKYGHPFAAAASAFTFAFYLIIGVAL